MGPPKVSLELDRANRADEGTASETVILIYVLNGESMTTNYTMGDAYVYILY